MIKIIVLCFILMNTVNAQEMLGTNFTYQGNLKFNNVNAQGAFDFQLHLFDSQSDGTGNVTGIATIEDLMVNDGVFIIPIDLGDTIFVGDKVWIEVHVRQGSEVGAFQKLLPRQEITSAPYAIHAQFVGVNAIGTDEIQTASVTSEKIAAQAVGWNEIKSWQVQRRLSDVCNNGSYIQSVNEDGSIVCAVDQIGSGLTTVTSNDIVDTTIATIDLSDNLITQAKIATNAVGLSEIISTQVQRRVTASCMDYFYLNGIDEDGSPQCKQLPYGFDSIPDSSGDVGSYSSIAVRGYNQWYGLPIVSYYDATNNSLKVYSCNNSVCSTGSVFSLDTGGSYSSIAIGINGYPVISYYDSINGALKIYNCSSRDCSTGTASTLDNAGDVGTYTSIAIQDNGNPIISYYDIGNGDLNVYNCTNDTCSTGNAYILDSVGDVGEYTSIAIGINGFPIISYSEYAASDRILKVFSCNNYGCATGGNAYSIDVTPGAGYFTDIAIKPNGNAIISYHYSSSPGELRVYNCANVGCSTGSSNTLPSDITIGVDTSIAIKPDGNPIISHWAPDVQDLNIYSCDDSTCSKGSNSIANDHFKSVGRYTSLAIGINGNPIISYYDTSNMNLKVYSCGVKDCSK